MPIFQFAALSASGSEETGQLDAADHADAQRQLSGRGCFVTRLQLVSSETASGASRLPSAHAGERHVTGPAHPVAAAHRQDHRDGAGDEAQSLLEDYGWVIEPVALGGVRLRKSAGVRWFMLASIMFVLLVAGGLLSWMIVGLGKWAVPANGGLFAMVWTLFPLAIAATLAPIVVACVLQIVWLTLIREEWEAGTNSLEIRRRAIGIAWGPRYQSGELLVEARYDRTARLDAWRLAIKTDGQKHFLITESRISESGGLASNRCEIEAIAALLAKYTGWPVKSAQQEAQETARTSTRRGELPAALVKCGFRADVEGRRLIIHQPIRAQWIGAIVLFVVGGGWTTILAGGLESLIRDKSMLEQPLANLPWVLMMVLMMLPGVVGVLLGFVLLFGRTRWIMDHNLLIVAGRLFWWNSEKQFVDATLKLARASRQYKTKNSVFPQTRWSWQLQLLNASGTMLQKLRQDDDDDVPRLLCAVVSECTGWPVHDAAD
ncbi:MAG: hypothetical protein HY290_31720 [Planctomycetia bacterium]|nr:hypothetical protein [Planctomycetia bacterium]